MKKDRGGDSVVVEIRLWEYNSEIFRGKAKINSPRELSALFGAAQSKGLRLPRVDEESGWF